MCVHTALPHHGLGQKHTCCAAGAVPDACAPAPLLALPCRPAWGVAVGNWTWWSVLAGAAASGWLALLWMYNSSPTRQRERQQRRQQQRQQGAGGWHGAAGAAGPAGPGGTIRHLRNEVPKGAPDAVARILMVRVAGSSGEGGKGVGACPALRLLHSCQ